MSSLLYYSISSNLTEDEITKLDKQVYRNLFFTELPSSSKRKAKRICLYVVFMFAISKPLAPCAAVPLPLPPTAIHRLSPIGESRIIANKNYPQIASIAQPMNK